jgi:Zn-dependent protease with chaperone function
VTEDKSTRYHRLKRRTEIAGLIWAAVLLLGLVATGAARALDEIAARLSRGSLYLEAACLTVLLLLIHETVAVPLGWYSGFVLEQRYGLSRQSPSAWLVDHAKGTALSAVLAVAGVLLIYTTILHTSDWWWLAAGVSFAMLIVGLANLAPVLLLPLFFTFTPLDRESLRARLESLASRAGTRIVGVYEWALGTRTRKANAALAGLGHTRRILVSDTMLDQYSDDEIEVVLAHELGHHVHHDIWRSIALESAIVVLGFFAADRALALFGPGLGLHGREDVAGLPLIVASAAAVSLVLMPIGLALSRRHERRADLFALDLTGNPAAFLSAMRRLGAQNMAEENPSRLTQWLFYSHPPLEDRLRAATNWQGANSK